MRVAGHLVIVRSRAGTAVHLADRADPVASKCGLTDVVFTPDGPWIVGFGAYGRCRRIVAAEGYTHVVDSLDGSTTEL